MLYMYGREDLRKKGWIGHVPPADLIYRAQQGDSQVTFTDADFSKIPTIRDLLRSRIKHFSGMMSMDYTAQVVADINLDSCVNCGKCYMTCFDSGYQAIDFVEETHEPVVMDTCTGCGLCESVCPIPGTIFMRPREVDHAPQRGIMPGDTAPDWSGQIIKPLSFEHTGTVRANVGPKKSAL